MKIIRVKFLFVGFLFSFFFLPFLPEITSAASPPVIIWERSGAGYAYPQDLAITDTSDALYGVGSYSGDTNLSRWFIQKWDRSGNNSSGQPQPIWSIKDKLPWQGNCTAGSTARDVAINTSSTDSKNGLFVVGTQSAPLVPSGVVKPDLLWRVERRGFDSSLKEWFPRDVVDHDVPPLAWNSRKNVAYAVAVLDSGDSANDGIYSTGFTNGGTTMFYAGNWYVEKRLFGQIKEEATQATPKLIGDGLSRPTAIAVDTSSVSGPGVYVFGLDKVGIRLEKRNLSTLALINSFGSSGNGAEYMVTGTSWLMFSGGMAIDDTGIYVSYTDLSGLHVERWQKDGKNFRWKETVPGSGAADYTYDLKVNSDGVYVTGTQNIGGVNHWRIEKRNKNTGVTSDSVGWEDNSIIGWPFSVGMDSSGVYSYGWDASQSSWRIEKRGLAGAEPPPVCKLEFDPPYPPLSKTINEGATDSNVKLKFTTDDSSSSCVCQNVSVKVPPDKTGILNVTDPVDPPTPPMDQFKFGDEKAITLKAEEVTKNEDVIVGAASETANCEMPELAVTVKNLCTISCSPKERTAYLQTGRYNFEATTDDSTGSQITWNIDSEYDECVFSPPNHTGPFFNNLSISNNPQCEMKSVPIEVSNACGADTCYLNISRRGWIEANR